MLISNCCAKENVYIVASIEIYANKVRIIKKNLS